MQLALIDAPRRPRVRIGLALIHNLTARAEELTGMKAGALQTTHRGRDTSWVRFAVMKVAREHGRSLLSIARCFGKMDHTSVIYGIKRAVELEQDDKEFAELMKLLRREAV